MLSAQERERHDRFVAAFNRIDKYLREVTGMHRGSMPRVTESYLGRHPGWKDEKAWSAYTSLRNVIVHERYSPNSCLFIPTDEAVQDIERIDQNLRRPVTVGSRFKRDVVSIRGDTALTEGFDLIHANSYSQFPVCDDTECVGLLTENGITRWISENWKEIDRIDFDNVSVQEVLKHEEPRKNHSTYLKIPLLMMRSTFSRSISF